MHSVTLLMSGIFRGVSELIKLRNMYMCNGGGGGGIHFIVTNKLTELHLQCKNATEAEIVIHKKWLR